MSDRIKISVSEKLAKEIERFAKQRGLDEEEGIDAFLTVAANRLKSLRTFNKKKAEEAGKPPPKPRKKKVEEAEETEPKPKKRKPKVEATEEKPGRVKRPTPMKPRKKKEPKAEADPMAPILTEGA